MTNPREATVLDLAVKVRLAYRAKPSAMPEYDAALDELVRRAEQRDIANGRLGGEIRWREEAERQRDVLKDALAFYADADNWEPRTQRVRPAVTDSGSIARAALASPGESADV